MVIGRGLLVQMVLSLDALQIGNAGSFPKSPRSVCITMWAWAYICTFVPALERSEVCFSSTELVVKILFPRISFFQGDPELGHCLVG